jgi:hypothetical protein
LSENEQVKISLSLFDENIPRQHQQKVLFSLGAYYGLRGGGEPVTICLNNIKQDYFGPSHPLAGEMYVHLLKLTDKAHTLSQHTDYVRDTSETHRLPVRDFFDPTSGCPAGTLLRLAEKQPEGCVKLFNHVKGEGTDGVFTKRKMGKSYIARLFKEGAQFLGIKCPSNFCPQSLRAMFITNLANDPGVSPTERMAASRHNSVAASAIYQEAGGVSESRRFAALGIKVTPETDLKIYPSVTETQKSNDSENQKKQVRKSRGAPQQKVSVLVFLFYTYFDILTSFR